MKRRAKAVSDKDILDWAQKNKNDFGFDMDGKAWAYANIYYGVLRRRNLRMAISAAIHSDRAARKSERRGADERHKIL